MKSAIAMGTLLTTIGLAGGVYAVESNTPSKTHQMGEHKRGEHRKMLDPATVEKRLNQTKQELKITDAQEPAWQTFTAAVKEQAQATKNNHEARKRAAATNQTLTAPERMNRHIELMQQRLSGMQTVANAFSQLYNVLTPEQKAIADRQATRFKHG